MVASANAPSRLMDVQRRTRRTLGMRKSGPGEYCGQNRARVQACARLPCPLSHEQRRARQRDDLIRSGPMLDVTMAEKIRLGMGQPLIPSGDDATEVAVLA